MSDNNDSMYLINGSTLTDIANAIREKTGKTNKIYPSNMDEEILSISTGYQPITVDITQSEHQTITATATASSSQLPVVNGQISTPTAITVHASIEATDEGYVPGTLNQTSVVANWGDTVSFSASPAIQYVPFSITVNVDPSSYTSEASELASSYLTYPIAGVSFTLIPGQTVTKYVPPNTDYNVYLRSIDGYSWSHTRLQGNTGNGNSITLTLSKLTGEVHLYCRYQNGATGSCEYSGIVAGESVSGTLVSKTYSGYVGQSYSFVFTAPEGFTCSPTNKSGNFRTSSDTVTVLLLSNGGTIEIPDEDTPL